MFEVNLYESVGGKEIKELIQCSIIANIDSITWKEIVQELDTSTEEAVGPEEKQTVTPENDSEMRFLQNYKTNSSTIGKWSATTEQSCDSLPLKNFNGTENPKEAQEWLTKINYFAKINGWSPEEKLPVALRHLIGPARRLWLMQLNVPTTWANFQSYFSETYITGQFVNEKWQELLQRRQNENEPTFMYFADKLSLCNTVGLNLSQTKEQILIGLRSDQVYIQSAGWYHVEINDLLKHILQIEKMMGSRRRIHSDAQRNLVAGYTTSPIQNCNVTASCFQETRIFTCLSMLKNIFKFNKGRFRSGSRSDSKKIFEVSALCQSTPDWAAAIVKTVIINGTMKVLGLIDHGSSDCLMRYSVAKDGGWLLQSGNSNGAIIIGNTIYSKILIYLYMTIDDVRAEMVPLLILPDEALPYPLMVGRTWMEQRSIGYIRDEGGFRFFYLDNFQHFMDSMV